MKQRVSCSRRLSALDDVVVPVQQHRAAIAEVGEQRQAGVDGRAELLHAGIAMAGGNEDALFGEKLRRFLARIAFRRERDQPHLAVGGVQQAAHRFRPGWANVLDRVCADVALQRIDERAFQVDAPDHFADQGILAAERGDPAGPGGHLLQGVGNQRCQNARHAVGAKPQAGRPGLLRAGRRC